MEILAYGEDALTLWAIKSRLSVILQQLDDATPPSKCQILYRPSFGRRGFGEFDFVLLSQQRLYLGESKWDGSLKSRRRIVRLEPGQVRRHELFAFYVTQWTSEQSASWAEFEQAVSQSGRPIAPADSILAANLFTVLRVIREFYHATPPIVNVLLYFYNSGIGSQPPPQVAPETFQIVSLDYSGIARDHFVALEL
jgi:hypothetical protein